MTTTATPTRTRCTGNPRRRARPTLTEEDILRAEITALCEQIDRRSGATPGSAERGVYFWLWPRTDSRANLIALHADASRFLFELLTTGRISG